MATKIIMPQLGESVIEGTISSWLKKEGDSVEQYEPLLEIETDKVTTEATAEVPGTVLKILVTEGETVAVGTVLAYIGEAGEDVIPKLKQMCKHLWSAYCAFAPGAVAPVESLLAHFEDEVREHISQGKCPFK